MRNLYYLFLFLAVATTSNSCKSSAVSCPGAGQHQASDMSLFDDDGKPVSKKKKKKNSKKNENGLINRSQPTNMKRHVKKSINDRPKR